MNRVREQRAAPMFRSSVTNQYFSPKPINLEAFLRLKAPAVGFTYLSLGCEAKVA
jgi:hypothetical protein